MGSYVSDSWKMWFEATNWSTSETWKTLHVFWFTGQPCCKTAWAKVQHDVVIRLSNFHRFLRPQHAMNTWSRHAPVPDTASHVLNENTSDDQHNGETCNVASISSRMLIGIWKTVISKVVEFKNESHNYIIISSGCNVASENKQKYISLWQSL
jgi:hypothetical protein